MTKKANRITMDRLKGNRPVYFEDERLGLKIKIGEKPFSSLSLVKDKQGYYI